MPQNKVGPFINVGSDNCGKQKYTAPVSINISESDPNTTIVVGYPINGAFRTGLLIALDMSSSLNVANFGRVKSMQFCFQNGVESGNALAQKLGAITVFTKDTGFQWRIRPDQTNSPWIEAASTVGAFTNLNAVVGYTLTDYPTISGCIPVICGQPSVIYILKEYDCDTNDAGNPQHATAVLGSVNLNNFEMPPFITGGR